MVGQPTQFCIELKNPLGYNRLVTVDFAIADFGAGIGFTPVQSQDFTLPPNSIAKYCITWTPSAGGTLHRCALVTLHQEGYQDETSQRNVDLVNVPLSGLSQVDIPFFVGNPDLVTHTLTLDPMVFGLDPIWQPSFFINPGDPPPDVLGPGQILLLHLGFMGGGIEGATTQSSPLVLYGDSQRVEVSILLNGLQVGGFTVELAARNIFMPLMKR